MTYETAIHISYVNIIIKELFFLVMVLGMYLFTNPAVFFNNVQKGGGQIHVKDCHGVYLKLTQKDSLRVEVF